MLLYSVTLVLLFAKCCARFCWVRASVVSAAACFGNATMSGCPLAALSTLQDKVVIVGYRKQSDVQRASTERRSLENLLLLPLLVLLC